MIINPTRIMFESKKDVTDYVTKGLLPPRKKHFDEVMGKVRNPDARTTENISKCGKEVMIFENTIDADEIPWVEETMTDVYNNRIQNRNLTIGAISLVSSAILFTAIHNKLKENK